MAKDKKPTDENKIVTLAIQEGIIEITKKDKKASRENLLRRIDRGKLNRVIYDAYQFIEERPRAYSGKKGVKYLYNAVVSSVASGSVFYGSPIRGSLEERSKTMRAAAFIFTVLGVLFIAFSGINITGNVTSDEISIGESLFLAGFGVFLLILSFMAFSSYKKIRKHIK